MTQYHDHGEGFNILKYADGAASSGPRDAEKPGLYAPDVKEADKQERPAAVYMFAIECANDCADLTATNPKFSPIKGAATKDLIDAAVAVVAAL